MVFMPFDTRGSIGIFTALAIIPIMLVIGLGIEFRQAENMRANLQNALDSSLVAAVLFEDEAGSLDQGRQTFDGNISLFAASNPRVELRRVDANTVEGTARATAPPVLSQLLGLGGFNVSVSSRAQFAGQGAVPCIILTGTDVSGALVFNGGAQLTSLDCGINGHSTANPVALLNAGIDIDVPDICLAGTHIVNNSGPVDNLRLGCVPVADAFDGMIPMPPSVQCDLGLPRNVNGGSITLQPGVYCGGLNLNANVDVTFEPGLYVIRNGDWNVNGGDWEGAGVTFYFDDTSKIQFNSGVRAELTPPLGGNYEGVLFFERPGLPPSNFPLNDSRGFGISGLVQLPSRNVIINGNGDVRQRDALLVFNSLTFNSAHWELSNELLADRFPKPERIAVIVE